MGKTNLVAGSRTAAWRPCSVPSCRTDVSRSRGTRQCCGTCNSRPNTCCRYPLFLLSYGREFNALSWVAIWGSGSTGTAPFMDTRATSLSHSGLWHWISKGPLSLLITTGCCNLYRGCKGYLFARCMQLLALALQKVLEHTNHDSRSRPKKRSLWRDVLFLRRALSMLTVTWTVY